jgi:enoyl-CoA hydratase/carnithine racemase
MPSTTKSSWKWCRPFTELGARGDVRCIVLAANGPAFCAGADLNWMRSMADYTRAQNHDDAGQLARMMQVLYECPKPTIAKVQGDAYAGGTGLVAACDMAVSVDTAGTASARSSWACCRPPSALTSSAPWARARRTATS